MNNAIGRGSGLDQSSCSKTDVKSASEVIFIGLAVVRADFLMKTCPLNDQAEWIRFCLISWRDSYRSLESYSVRFSLTKIFLSAG